MCHGVSARLRISMACGCSAACLAVTEVPLVAADVLARGCAGKLGGIAATHRGGVETAVGLRYDGHCLCFGVGANAAAVDGERHRVGPWLGVGVGRILLRGGAAVTEVPLIAGDALSRRVGGGSAGELGGVALAYCGGGEVGRRLGVDDNLCGGCNGLRANGGHAGVGASHGHGAVGTAGKPLGGGPAARTRPAV